jgi:hypothetical protein
MSLLNELIAKVSALTSTVNQLTTNSKAIQELPAQETLNLDSLIHVSKDNTSKKITVQQIINAAISNQNDQIISIGTITLSGNDLKISDISAKINNVIQSISLPTIVNIPFCASGLKRIDLLVYNTSNEITRIAGTETSGAIVIAPTLPINSLLITQISVTDSVISEPQPPILGTNFLQKEFEKAQLVNATGSNVVIALNIKGRNNIILNGALTGVIGFSLTNLELNPTYAEYPHEGKDYFIQNKTGHSVTLKNGDETVDIGFLSKDGNDILLPNNGIVFFKKSLNILQEIFRSFQTLQSVTDEGNTTTNSITVPQIDLLEPEGTYSSTIKSQALSEDRELLAPDESGYIATQDYVFQQLFDGLETKQNKLFSLQKANGIVSVTGTLSETQVFKESFRMQDNFGVNSYGLGFFLNIYSLFSKIGSSSGYTIRVKLSTLSTMPSGATDQIAVFNGTSTNLYAQLIRNFSIIRPVSLGNMQIHGFPFTTSSINDFAVGSSVTTSRDILYGDIYYLYVSVQLTTSTADTLNFISLKASNV